ncbi:MAG: TetR/AcrR family transcriptional regulator [Acidobacteriota bacterium]|nr:TetR/AcrR family transcriptional regulator [Acidobacteriota bacterium]
MKTKTDRTGLRRQILDATRSLLLSEGVKNLSMRKIAAEIGCKAPSIYYHFENKAALIQALVEEGHQLLFSLMEEAVGRYTDPLQRLEAYMRAYVRFGLDNPVYYEIMFMLRADESGYDPIESFRQAKKSQAPAIEAFQEAERQGLVSTDDFIRATGAIGIMLHGYLAIILNYPENSPFQPDEMLDYIIDRVFRSHGIGGEPYKRHRL